MSSLHNLPKAFSAYGASMGRSGNISEPNFPVKMHLVKLELDDGGYDSGGAYWGLGDSLYRAQGDGENEVQEVFVRGKTRGHAIDEVRKVLPLATFFSGDKKWWWSSSSGVVELQLSSQCIEDCAHSGQCFDDTSKWAARMSDILIKIDTEKLIDCLSEYGAWSREELAASTRDRLESILIWVSANDIKNSDEYVCA